MNHNNNKENQLPPKMENSVLYQKVMEKMHLKLTRLYIFQIQDYTVQAVIGIFNSE